MPNAPYGVPFIIGAAGSFSIGVRTTPGEIALTRTPGDPNSAAQARVRVSIAPFVEAYSAPTGIPNRATQEPRLMIDPDPWAVISRRDRSGEEERRLDVDRVDLVEHG